MDNTEIARIAHEINRAYNRVVVGDEELPPWDDYDRQEMVLQGVRFALDEPDATPEQSHQSWLAGMEALGWKYGEEKDEEAKTHPCMVPYSELPVEQQAKDSIFLTVARLLKPLVEPAPLGDPTSGQVAVKYVGKRETYSDSLYDTGNWLQGQTKLVSEGVASKMFAHPDVYAPSDDKPAEAVAPKDGDQGDESKPLQQARDAVLAMTKKAAVIEFISSNWAGMENTVDSKMKLPELQAAAIRLIDQYRLP